MIAAKLIDARHALEDRVEGRCNRAAVSAEQAVRGVWRDVVSHLESATPYAWGHNFHRLRAIFATLPTALITSVGTSLAKTAEATSNEERDAILTHLPLKLAKSLLRKRGLTEARNPALEKFADFILPRATQQQVQTAFFNSGWATRIANLSKLADPDALAATLASSLSQGATPREAAKQIRPLVQGVQTSARRVARHEVIRTAHEVQHAEYESLGELVIGYQTHAVPRTEYSREIHLKRSGTIYYRNPTGSQLGFDAMPRPPMEADGSIAWGCRCYNTPVLAELGPVPTV